MYLKYIPQTFAQAHKEIYPKMFIEVLCMVAENRGQTVWPAPGYWTGKHLELYAALH